MAADLPYKRKQKDAQGNRYHLEVIGNETFADRGDKHQSCGSGQDAASPITRGFRLDKSAKARWYRNTEKGAYRKASYAK